ncbi:MAG: 3-hydroxyacyl-CoA dehydrogenase family protein [Acidimicrobiales bacterium]
MFESGFASKEDIDQGMVTGCAHPMGPLALADLIGLDTTMAVAESLYEEFKEQLARRRHCWLVCEAGLLGRKTGRGSTTTTEPGSVRSVGTTAARGRRRQPS